MRDERAVSLIAILAHGIPHEFPPDVLAEVRGREAGAAARPRGLARAARSSPSIPPTPRTMTMRSMPSPTRTRSNPGGFIVTVAIADVSWYVRPGSALDREALKRGNSVYFPDRVVPMLPERISNDLCSLREGEDRPALAVRMVFTRRGPQAQPPLPPHHDALGGEALLPAGAGGLRRPRDRRRRAGPGRARRRCGRPTSRSAAAARAATRWNSTSPSGRCCSGRTARSTASSCRSGSSSHRLIEEFMIQANVAAAETLEERKSPLVYRIHDTPSMAKLEALRDFLKSIDLTLPKSGNLRPSHFNRILEQVQGHRARAAGPRGRAAQPGPGRVQPGEHRPFRPQSPPLRPLHLADPPLCRPHRPPRPGPRAEARRRRPAGGDGDGAAGDRGADFRRRAAGDGGRARHHRPARRALAGRPGRGDLPRPHLGRHPRRAVRQARRDRRRRLRADIDARPRTTSSTTRPGRP